MKLLAYSRVLNGEERYGFINENGNIVIEPKFTYAEDFSENLALVKTYGSNKLRFINAKGENEILLGGCSNAKSFKNGLALCEYNKKWALINKKGENLTGFVFDKPEDAKVNDLMAMSHLIRENGVKALNWASDEMLEDEGNYKILKQSLKYHLKDLVKVIDESKVESEEQFRALVQNELDTFNNIRKAKVKNNDKEKEF
ncbi:MAG: WG repeat-containing protein [Clostridiales bacterium]|nr:WG repeat-containing protein [Clostridiales bacterium]